MTKCCDGDDRDPQDEKWRFEITETIYDSVHRMADSRLRRERVNHTLCATDLTHAVLVGLHGKSPPVFADRSQMLRYVGSTMRSYLVDHARRRRKPASIDVEQSAEPAPDDRTLAVHAALSRLEEWCPRVARVVELRWFAGLRYVDIADALELSERTVRGDWALARSWLYTELSRI